ncbi:MAG: response regulator transcription factor [Firmicutes bacterium]|nr:response regulator transcription factor [Bacillota bacterium]
MRILVAEDERDLNEMIRKKLTSEGYSVDTCYDGEDALAYLDVTEYDGVILDIMMPGRDGLQVLREMRRKGIHTPVMFLTARDSIEDRVKGLDAGATDYVVKPFSFKELMARVRAMTREKYGTSSSILQVGDLTMDTASQKVARGERNIDLSAKEYALLRYMMTNSGIVLSRDMIEDHVWNYDYEGGTNVVDVYIRYLRRKIDEGEEQKLIQTVRGRGYVIRADE